MKPKYQSNIPLITSFEQVRALPPDDFYVADLRKMGLNFGPEPGYQVARGLAGEGVIALCFEERNAFLVARLLANHYHEVSCYRRFLCRLRKSLRKPKRPSPAITSSGGLD